MIERTGDMFEEYLDPGVLYAITTNGYVKNDGTAVMGAGVAKTATELQTRVRHILGDYILAWGNHCYLLPGNMVSVPVKHHWKEKADVGLIGRSLSELRRMWLDLDRPWLYLPRPGCGNGQLSWYHVRPLVESYFGTEDRVVIWSLEE